jgi:hypothetical protein
VSEGDSFPFDDELLEPAGLVGDDEAIQLIRVGHQQVKLPPGVTVTDWSLERVRVRNPCIRAYLGCIQLLEEVLDSNYAILHCSPGRLLQIWRKVRRVCRLMRTELAPTLTEPSVIPKLEAARRRTEYSYLNLGNGVIADIERYPHRIPADQLSAVRKLLCVSIGKLYAFLRDTFGEILAHDPRSLHDADYYLSRRFPQDIEEAEWLYITVDGLNGYLQSLGQVWSRQLNSLADQMRTEKMIPNPTVWEEVEIFLNLLITGLTRRLKEVLSLRGIRFEEMDTLDKYTFEIPHNCKALIQVYSATREMIDLLKNAPTPVLEERRQRVRDLVPGFLSRRHECADGVVDRSHRPLAARPHRLCAALAEKHRKKAGADAQQECGRADDTRRQTLARSSPTLTPARLRCGRSRRRKCGRSGLSCRS